MNSINKENNPNNNFAAEKEQVRHLDNEKQKFKDTYEEGKDKTETLFNQTKDSVSDLYEEGVKKMEHAQDIMKDYSKDLIKMVNDKPLSALLIAGGIGFLLSALIKK